MRRCLYILYTLTTPYYNIIISLLLFLIVLVKQRIHADLAVVTTMEVNKDRYRSLCQFNLSVNLMNKHRTQAGEKPFLFKRKVVKIRSVILTFTVLFVMLQYQLWFATDGILSVYRLYENLNHQAIENKKLTEHNTLLTADIFDLKYGNQAIEERARNDLGMIKKGEVFYQIAHPY